MKYNLYTFTALDQKQSVAELIQLTNHKDDYKELLSPEELNILAKGTHKHKQTELI